MWVDPAKPMSQLFEELNRRSGREQKYRLMLGIIEIMGGEIAESVGLSSNSVVEIVSPDLNKDMIVLPFRSSARSKNGPAGQVIRFHLHKNAKLQEAIEMQASLLGVEKDMLSYMLGGQHIDGQQPAGLYKLRI